MHWKEGACPPFFYDFYFFGSLSLIILPPMQEAYKHRLSVVIESAFSFNNDFQLAPWSLE